MKIGDKVKRIEDGRIGIIINKAISYENVEYPEDEDTPGEEIFVVLFKETEEYGTHVSDEVEVGLREVQ